MPRVKAYLVTGGLGVIGSALVRRLIKDGYRVRVLDNHSRGSADRLADCSKEFEFVEGDIRNAEAVRNAMRGMDGVCHLAFVNGTEFFYTQPDVVLEVGVKGIVNVLDACRQEGVGELVLASSSEVYQTPPVIPTDETVPLSIPDPWNPRYSYAAGKIISELMAINYGRKHLGRVVIFRPHNVYGPDMGWEHVIPQFVVRMHGLCRQVPAGTIRFEIQGTGKETRAFVFIDDFIDALMLVITKGAHLNVYHIGTTEELAIAEVARQIGNYFGRQLEIIPGRPVADGFTAESGGTPRRCPDISKLAALGYHPNIPFKAGLPVVARWYVENAHRTPDRAKQDTG